MNPQVSARPGPSLGARLVRKSFRPFQILQGSYHATNGAIVASWWGPTRNWGDALNPLLISWLSGKRVVHLPDTRLSLSPTVVYYVVGSILQDLAHDSAVVWGSGLIDESLTVPKHPLEVRAVRGPLTRDALQRQGISVPAVYGDPALLMPLIYAPPSRSTRKYRLGIIPHMHDYGTPDVARLGASPGVTIIDILSPTYTLLDKLFECEAIASSSLHGLIAADAYGIPNVWIECGDRLMGRGFKFRDYFSSTGRPLMTPLSLSSHTSVTDILVACGWRPLEIDIAALIDACPFMPPHRRSEVMASAMGLGVFAG